MEIKSRLGTSDEFRVIGKSNGDVTTPGNAVLPGCGCGPVAWMPLDFRWMSRSSRDRAVPGFRGYPGLQISVNTHG